MDWHEGYVANIDYEVGFFPEQSPVHLNFVCILNGVEPVPLDCPFSYFELGSGQGFTSNLLAAANPQGRFYAADFNPAHVAASAQLAQAAELDNMVFLEASFADLADGSVDLPQFDFITLHGVYSWVNAENRAHIMRFIARYLKPGGIAHISYNAMPGWTSTLPLQRLILEHVDLYPSGPQEQIRQMRLLLDALVQNKAGYLTSNAGMLGHYLKIAQHEQRSGYLAHEFMNQGWQPLYHADVARAGASAKLEYVGSAGLAWAFPELSLSADQRLLLDGVADPILRETLKDYLKNTCFREDVYVRGARRMSAGRRDQWLAKIGLALPVRRETVEFKPDTSFSQLTPDGAFFDALLDVLAEGPKTLLDLASLPLMAGKNLAEIARIAAVLVVATPAKIYFLSGAGQDVAPARRLNNVIADNQWQTKKYQMFAAPLLGTAVAAPLCQRLVYRTLSSPTAASQDITAITAQVWQRMQEQYETIHVNDREVPLDDSVLVEVRKSVDTIVELGSPIWRKLQMLP